MAESSDGTTIIDISKEFEHIIVKVIIHITFGEDINEEEFEIWMRNDIVGLAPMTKARVKLSAAMQEIFD